MKVKDIIQVSAYYPPHLGGQENAVFELATQLAAAGHHVHVLTSAVGGDVAGTKQEDGVLVRRMRGPVFGHAPIMPAFFGELFRAATANTIVHLHIGQAFTPEMVWLVSKLRHFKYVAELHIDFEPSGPAGVLLPLYKRLILRRVLHGAASVITLNDKTLRTVRKAYGYRGNAQVMHNGIDELYFSIDRPALTSRPPQTLRLLFVGRLSKQKNIAALLKALAITKRKVHLDLIGDGEELESVKEMIKSLRLTNVRLHGRKTRHEVMKFYKICHVLVMPSLYEAQPLVLLEAMAARIPVIGTNVIGVEDHIKDAGLIVEPSAEGVVEGIEQYYRRYPELGAMVERASSLADAFRWRNTLKGYEELYETVVGS